MSLWASPVLGGKESACNAGDTGLTPGLERSSGEGNGNPLQYVCLGNPMDRGACWAICMWLHKSWTQLNNKVGLHIQGRLLEASNLSKANPIPC